MIPACRGHLSVLYTSFLPHHPVTHIRGVTKTGSRLRRDGSRLKHGSFGIFTIYKSQSHRTNDHDGGISPHGVNPIKAAELFTFSISTSSPQSQIFLLRPHQKSGMQREILSEILSERFIRFSVACNQIVFRIIEYYLHSSVRQLPEKLSEDDKGS